MLGRFNTSRGDTIVEVLIAISIAGLAIGTSYAIAHRALQNAIAARERDQAVGLLENQVAALKLRKQLSSATNPFDQFDATSHYCLNAAASDPITNPEQWKVIKNNAIEPLSTSGIPPAYDSACAIGGLYFLDIDTTTKDTNTTTTNFRLDVRWPRLGGGSDNDATFYYRF